MLQRHGGQKCGDHHTQHWHGKDTADPQPPRHIGQLRIGFFGGHLPRLKRHAADWARTWSIAHDLRMHRTGIFRALGWRGIGCRFECHAALGAATRTRLLDLWMHGAGVFPLRLGLGRRVRGSCVRLGLRVLLRRGAELGGAALAAEEDGGPLMINACRRLGGINLHPAYGIVLLSLLHGLIVGLVAQFDLYLSALSVPMTNGCRQQPEALIDLGLSSISRIGLRKRRYH